MDTIDFERALRAEGYDEVITRDWEPGRIVPEHTHPFDARVIVLDGEVTLGCGGRSQTYRSGEIFALPAGTPHTETYGPAGARFLAGRRKPATTTRSRTSTVRSSDGNAGP